MRNSIIVLLIFLISNLTAFTAEKAIITIQTDKTGNRISPLLYGIFFEEINRAGDGGLYAEMVQNRSFEDSNKPVAWTLENKGGNEVSLSLDNSKPLNDQNPKSLFLKHTPLYHWVNFGVFSLHRRLSAINKRYLPVASRTWPLTADYKFTWSLIYFIYSVGNYRCHYHPHKTYAHHYNDFFPFLACILNK